jgi:phospholipid/cholesterol/gamma-HCH transport system substrate-binding protein
VTIARGAAIGSLLAAIVAVAVLMFGSEEGTEYKLRFQNAGQLVSGNQVQIAGKAVGKVTDIELTDDNLAQITINVEDEFAPLHEGTTAVVRVASLPSIANRNISLHPGPNSSPELEEGALLDTDKTTTPVDLDQIFNTLDPKTRRSLQDLLQGFANWYVGRGKELNASFRYLGPALSSTSQLMRELAADQKVFTRFVLDTSKLVTTLSERRDDISGFVGNTNAVMKAIGDENVQLSRALQFLPGTLRKANTTFVRLRGALDELDELTNATKPVAPKLAPFFRRLNTLVKTSTPTFHDFGRLLRENGRDNDLIDLLRTLPELADVTDRAFPNSIKALRRSQSVIEFLRPYAPDFTGWITKFGVGNGYYDANGHYIRVQPIFNAFSFQDNGADGVLTRLTPAQRKDIITDRGNERRCPGSALAPGADASNPSTDDGKLGADDCDPALRPPGP